jgi:CNT family concentrative nucleoside transporter
MLRSLRVGGLFLLFGIAGAAGGWLALRPLSAGEPAVAEASAPAEPTAAQAQVQRLKDAQTPVGWGARATSLLGLFVLLGLCWAVSSDRRRVDWRLVAWGTGLQLLFAVVVLKTAPGLWVFARLNDLVNALLGFTQQGTDFLFRSFATGRVEPGSINFAFQVLPTIIFFSSLMTVLYHVGAMQWLVKVFAVAMQRTMKTSGAETLSTSANIFVGQTEAPLVVKPYIEKMTRSELMAVMVGGFANTAGGVLAAYVGMLRGHFPDIAGHLIAQSVMSAPAALVCAKLAYPETQVPETRGDMRMKLERPDANVIDAAARGATEGLHLAFNVAAMLLAFIALVAMLNAGLRAVGGWAGWPSLSLELLFGWVGAPVAWVLGVPWADCVTVGRLIGVKTVVNEFVAYTQLAELLARGEPISYRSVVIASYALSGFANFASIAIQIGGISAIAPSRRHDLARLGLKAMFIGAVATFTTACVAGFLL